MKTANEWFIGLPQREDSVYEFKREEIITLLNLWGKEYSDQQNKELREEREQLAEQYRKDGEQINDMILQHEEDSEVIIALKKEVEELNWVKDEIDTAREWMKVHEGENSRYLQIQEELTRLRELLGRSKDYIFLGYVGAVELCDAIDNELNPKP